MSSKTKDSCNININSKYYIITAGGTGGHIFPALNLALNLLSSGNNKVVFLTDNRFKNFYQDKYPQVFNNDNFTIKYLDIKKFSGFKNPIKFINFCYSLIISIYQTFMIGKNKQNSVIVGFGGYVSIPVIMYGILTRKEIILHEQNAILGRVNKLFLPFCKTLYTSFKKTIDIKNIYQDKVKQCGVLFSDKFEKLILTKYNLQNNKLKTNTTNQLDLSMRVDSTILDILNNKSKTNVNLIKQNTNINITILGGSLGASFFNDSLASKIYDIVTKHCNENLTNKSLKKININHQVKTQIDAENVLKIYNTLQQSLPTINIVFDVKTFFINPEEIISNSDVIISRCGASSVCEAYLSDAKCIFVPIKKSAKNHQFLNAQYFCNQESKGNIFIATEKNNSIHEGLEYIFKKILN